MDLTGIHIPRMNSDSANLLEELKKFRQHVELILKGALEEKEESAKVTYMLFWFGEKGREIFNTLLLKDEARQSTKAIFDAFQTHVQPRSNPVFNRYKFHNEKQAIPQQSMYYQTKQEAPKGTGSLT